MRNVTNVNYIFHMRNMKNNVYKYIDVINIP